MMWSEKSVKMWGLLMMCATCLMGNAWAQQPVPECSAELFVVLDASGSMATRDEECLTNLRRDRGDENLQVEKPCLTVILHHARDVYDHINEACQASGAGAPRASITAFRCPKDGKEFKTWMDPTRISREIDQGFERASNQQVNGNSCASGAVGHVASWIEQRTAEAGEEFEYDPVILLVTDGAVSDKGRTNNELKRITEISDPVVLGSVAFPNRKTDKRFSDILPTGVLLNASSPEDIKKIQITAHPVVREKTDLVKCSAEQTACIERRASLLDSNQTCPVIGSLYEGIAACASSGCAGADLTQYKDKCLEESSCQLDCGEITLHINAQNYSQGGIVDRAYMAESKTPAGLVALNRAFESKLTFPLAAGWISEVPGSISPLIEMNDESLLLATSTLDSGASKLLAYNRENGQIKWSFESSAQIIAQPILDANSVVIGNEDGVFFRINAEDGTLEDQWTFGPGRIEASAAAPGLPGYVVVAISGSPGLLPPMLHKVSTSEEGAKRAWKRLICSEEKDADGVVEALLLSKTPSILLACRSGLIQSYSLIDGSRDWSLPMGEVTAPPVIDEAGEFMYVLSSTGSNETSLHRISLVGEVDWSVPLAAPSDISPLLDQGRGQVIVMTRQGDILSFNSISGEQNDNIGSLPGDELINVGLVLSDKRILVVCRAAKMFFFDLDNLEQIGEVTASSWITTSPIILDNSIFVTTNDAAVERFDTAKPLRRMLAHPDSGEWPSGAVALTLVLIFILAVLLLTIRVLCES